MLLSTISQKLLGNSAVLSLKFLISYIIGVIGIISTEMNNRKRFLPVEATLILTRWLQKNCEDPYPTEEDKKQLALLTNLKLRQIDDWFINARRRKLTGIRRRVGVKPKICKDKPRSKMLPKSESSRLRNEMSSDIENKDSNEINHKQVRLDVKCPVDTDFTPRKGVEEIIGMFVEMPSDEILTVEVATHACQQEFRGFCKTCAKVAILAEVKRAKLETPSHSRLHLFADTAIYCGPEYINVNANETRINSIVGERPTVVSN